MCLKGAEADIGRFHAEILVVAVMIHALIIVTGYLFKILPALWSFRLQKASNALAPRQRAKI
jgi:hypothetical protein